MAAQKVGGRFASFENFEFLNVGGKSYFKRYLFERYVVENAVVCDSLILICFRISLRRVSFYFHMRTVCKKLCLRVYVKGQRFRILNFVR
jgi:hypothetical protein